MKPTKFKVNVQQSSLIIRKLPNGEPTGLFAVKGSIVEVDKEEIVMVDKKETRWSRIASGWVSSKFLLKVEDEVVAPPKPGLQNKFTHQPIIYPVRDFLVLRTAGLATPQGAMFGMTRKHANGKPKPHQGIDLAVPPGEPIFAVEKGTELMGKASEVVRTEGRDAAKGSYVYWAFYTLEKSECFSPEIVAGAKTIISLYQK